MAKIISILISVFKVLQVFAKPFSKWLENRQKKKRAEMYAEVRSLKLKRTAIKRELKIAKGDQRAKLLETYHYLNDRILYLERILHQD